jgi:hypothetical protein
MGTSNIQHSTLNFQGGALRADAVIQMADVGLAELGLKAGAAFVSAGAGLQELVPVLIAVTGDTSIYNDDASLADVAVPSASVAVAVVRRETQRGFHRFNKWV